jgi:hypothetical protein
LLLWGHAGVATDTVAFAVALTLDFSRGEDAFAQGGGRFAGLFACELAEFDDGDFEVQVDAVP